MEDRRKPWTFQSDYTAKNFKEILDRLSRKTYRRIEREENLINEMEVGDCMLIASGEISMVAVGLDGGRFEIARVHRGGVAGILPLTSSDVRYQLLVTYPVEVYVVSETELKKVLSEMKASVPYKVSLFGRSIHIPISPMLGMDIHERVLYILDYIAVFEEGRSGRRVIDVSPSKISVLTGIKREVVSLAFAKLIKHGLISVIHGNIMVKKR